MEAYLKVLAFILGIFYLQTEGSPGCCIPNNVVSYVLYNEGNNRLYSLLILSTRLFGNKELMAWQDGLL